jgi:hypothetical protein
MPTIRENSKRRRSRSVPLSLVPALAALIGATACSSRDPVFDPCEPDSYTQVACDAAVVNHGYWYSGTWYPHVYPYAGLWYMNRYSGYVGSGGRVRTMSPTVYSPSYSAPARPSVVRGGFGGIGAGIGAAGS